MTLGPPRYLCLGGLCIVTLVLTLSCSSGEKTVQLSSPATTPPTAIAPSVTDQHATPTAYPDSAPDEARAVPPRIGQAGTPSPTPSTNDPDALALRTRRPVDGFDLDPPYDFEALEYYPLHGKSMVIDGHRVGIRFFGKHGTGQSVLMAVWSDSADGAEAALERYQAHTGDVHVGRPVQGASAVWELRERPAPGRSTRTGLSVYLPDGTGIAVNGTNIDDVSTLYQFLTRIEDAPGALEPMPDSGEAIPGGVQH